MILLFHYFLASLLQYTKKKKKVLIHLNIIMITPGQPISVLDGIPIAIKDEIDCSPYPTTGNSTCYGITFTMSMFFGYDKLDLC